MKCQWIFLALFLQVNADCFKEDCYESYEDELANMRKCFQHNFDDILENYNVTEGNLNRTIETLLFDIMTVVNKLVKFELNNENGKNGIRQLNETLIKLIDMAKIDVDADNLNLTLPNIDEPNVDKSMLNNVDEMVKNLGNYQEILDEFIWKNITDLPYSTRDEIALINSLLEMKPNRTCLDEFEKKLKDLFKKLATLIHFEKLQKQIVETNEQASKNKKNGEKILGQSEKIRKDHEHQNVTLELSKKTLNLAVQIEKLKEDINNFNIDVYDRKAFYDELKKLFDKYKVEDYLQLLEELREVNEKINKLDDVKETMDEYLKRINKAIKFIENCKKTV